jgi:hypothetical protein
MITNLIIKLVLTPVIVIICDLLSPLQINYNAVYEAIVIGLFVGIINYALEWLMLAKGTFWVTTILDFIITLCVVFFGTMLYDDAVVSTLGALTITFLVAVMEYLLHSWLLRNHWHTKLAVK